MERFLGFTGLEWMGLSAVAGGVYDILTACLIGFAGLQIYFTRRDAQINRALAACEKYDLDPLLDAICRRLAAARDSGELHNNTYLHRVDIYTILNYLESIAIGTRRGLYCRKTVRAQMEPIIVGYVQEYIDSGLVSKAAPPNATRRVVTGEDYEHMVFLVKQWERVPWYRRIFSGRKTKNLTAT
jgi:hypothetical protein